MSSKQVNGTNLSSLPDVEGTETIPFGRRLLKAQRGPKVYAPVRNLSRRWRAMVVHKVYSLKLYKALRLSRRSTTVRDVADKMLAITARGTTRWSRDILVSPPGKRRKLSPVRSRVRVLGGLVPGCRRTALPELLDETAGYIAALEMQVRAMTALSKILSEFQPSDKLGSAL